VKFVVPTPTFVAVIISVKSAFIRVMQKGYAVPDISKSILAVISESV
jgi:hypothetical protein